eukprot:scaffold3139_cov110-Isochrysis_galbana.AAC.10
MKWGPQVDAMLARVYAGLWPCASAPFLALLSKRRWGRLVDACSGQQRGCALPMGSRDERWGRVRGDWGLCTLAATIEPHRTCRHALQYYDALMYCSHSHVIKRRDMNS